MPRTRQNLIDDLGYISRLISTADSEFALAYMDISSDEDISIKNKLSRLLMLCIEVRQELNKQQE